MDNAISEINRAVTLLAAFGLNGQKQLLALALERITRATLHTEIALLDAGNQITDEISVLFARCDELRDEIHTAMGLR